ncbi:MAG: hypothetical protein LUC44_05500, partial [Prevotellaceae bacterium]|nr:hypothetical protein [Prevotellaceae bacterium]
MMRQTFMMAMLGLVAGICQIHASAATPENDGGTTVIQLSPKRVSSSVAEETKPVEIKGTGESRYLPVTLEGLTQDVTVTTTTGFSVSPTVISADEEEAEVTVTLTSSLAYTTGQLILRSGDMRCYVDLIGRGTPLETKDLSASPAYTGGTD